VKTVVAYQDENSGLWYQVLDQGGRQDNYLESSASAMFVYFLLKANRLGIIDESASLKAARMGYDGLVKNRIRKDEHGLYHLDGICSVAGLGGNPYRNGSYAYYVKEPVVMDDFKGVGPFILASIELAKSLS
jgi:unsaturated rhamnogalacturonyl hydrolase